MDKQDPEQNQLSLLSSSEGAKAARLKSLRERRRYVTGRAFTRRVLGNIIGVSPEKLEFWKTECGRPMLSNTAITGQRSTRTVAYNTSHSGNILGIAVASGFEIGLDIELLNPDLDFLAIAQGNLEPLDENLVQSSSPRERAHVFYRLWTRNEALAKMRGHGIISNHTHGPSSNPPSLRTFEFTMGTEKIVVSLSLDKTSL